MSALRAIFIQEISMALALGSSISEAVEICETWSTFYNTLHTVNIQPLP